MFDCWRVVLDDKVNPPKNRHIHISSGNEIHTPFYILKILTEKNVEWMMFVSSPVCYTWRCWFSGLGGNKALVTPSTDHSRWLHQFQVQKKPSEASYSMSSDGPKIFPKTPVALRVWMGLLPNAITLSSVLSACQSAQRWQMALAVQQLMLGQGMAWTDWEKWGSTKRGLRICFTSPNQISVRIYIPESWFMFNWDIYQPLTN